MDSRTDAALLGCIALGDQKAFGELYDRYAGAAFSLAYRILGDGHSAEDVVQEAFLNIWRRASSFDSIRGNARSWTLAIIHHRAVDLCRLRRGAPPLSYDGNLPSIQHAATDIWQDVSESLDREALLGALTEISADQRHLIELAYFGGYTHREIAASVDLPLGTVKSRIRRGIGMLRELLVEGRGVFRAEP